MCDNTNPIEQAVEFSTRGGVDFTYNVSRPQEYWPEQDPKGATTSWQWEFREMHKDCFPPFADIQRGLRLRFEPKHQFPFKSLHIDSVNLPIWGMMSHVVGKVEMFLIGLPSDPESPYAYPEIASCYGIFTLVGWDCQNAHEVLQKYYKILTAGLNPDIASRAVEFIQTPSGAFCAVVKIPGVQFGIIFYDNNQLYQDRLNRFFGRNVNGYTASYGAPIVGLDPMEFPFVNTIRLNTRLVTQQLAERSFSRNLESTTQTQVIATFPWSSRSLEEVGNGSTIQKHFFAVAPTISKNTLTSTKDFCCVQSIDFWFTYGENDDNLYETFMPSSFDQFAEDDPALPDASWTRVNYLNADSELLYTYEMHDGPNEVDNGNTSDDTKNRTWTDIFFRRELSIFGTFNRCGCKTNVNDPRYILSHS